MTIKTETNQIAAPAYITVEHLKDEAALIKGEITAENFVESRDLWGDVDCIIHARLDVEAAVLKGIVTAAGFPGAVEAEARERVPVSRRNHRLDQHTIDTNNQSIKEISCMDAVAFNQKLIQMARKAAGDAAYVYVYDPVAEFHKEHIVRGFGLISSRAHPGYLPAHYVVSIDRDSGDVAIIATPGTGYCDQPEVKARFTAAQWGLVASWVQREFNIRLKESEVCSAAEWQEDTLMDTHLGRELCTLAWKVDGVTDLTEVGVALDAWMNLTPAQRWTLFMTNGEGTTVYIADPAPPRKPRKPRKKPDAVVEVVDAPSVAANEELVSTESTEEPIAAKEEVIVAAKEEAIEAKEETVAIVEVAEVAEVVEVKEALVSAEVKHQDYITVEQLKDEAALLSGEITADKFLEARGMGSASDFMALDYVYFMKEDAFHRELIKLARAKGAVEDKAASSEEPERVLEAKQVVECKQDLVSSKEETVGDSLEWTAGSRAGEAVFISDVILGYRERESTGWGYVEGGASLIEDSLQFSAGLISMHEFNIIAPSAEYKQSVS